MQNRIIFDIRVRANRRVRHDIKREKQMKYADLIAKMTLEEKASLCSGKDMWHFKGIERLGIPSIMVSDGPHGLRTQQDSGVSTKMNVSVDATCFPLACSTACSWDRDLVREIGKRIGEEAQKEGVQVVLGPGVNIKRSPLCGRNFEYYSEDPYLSGELGAALVEGLDSQGIGASVKHYAINNQETYRMSVNAVVDERTMREIYLPAFEKIVKKSKPATVMASYNLVNGQSATENVHLLDDILVKEWGFDGLVVSDWGAVNHRAEGVAAGMHVEMPSSGGMNDEIIVEAVKAGKLDEKVLDERVDRILEVVFELDGKRRQGATYDIKEHDEFARKAAADCCVLLKNKNKILPLNKKDKILVVGDMARNPRFQGAGSSFINCHKITSALDALEEEGIAFGFEEGYYKKTRKDCSKLIAKAVARAKDFDKVVIFAGLPGEYEAEGFDRKDMEMPSTHNTLISEIAKVNKNVIVVLSCGSVVTMPWIDEVRGVLLTGLAGQNSGGATVDVLYGKVNPSGKLAETYPLKLAHVPSTAYFPGERYNVEYREGLYVGYRYFESVDAPVLFPFGFGLSYTNFTYKDIQVDKTKIDSDGTVTVTVTVENTGDRDGKEIVQLYVLHSSKAVYMPKLQLRAFEKVEVKAKSSATVSFVLDKRAFAFYDVNEKNWMVESGEYEIAVGGNVRELKLRQTVSVSGVDSEKIKPVAKGWYFSPDVKKPVSDDDFKSLFNGGEITRVEHECKKGSFTSDDSFEDMANTSGLASFMLKFMKPMIRMSMNADKYDPNYLMIYEVMKTSPLRSLAFSSQGMFNMKMVDGIVIMMNGHFFKGLFALLKAIKK